jgi:hypothetical protein
MAVAALLYAMIGLLAAAIGLLAATSVPLQIRPTAEGSIVTSQYCVPPNDGIDLHKVSIAGTSKVETSCNLRRYFNRHARLSLVPP